ncbi:MAG: methionine ABC transporter permease [Gordonia sp. (in: high G+C Gram-positive bacteria)]
MSALADGDTHNATTPWGEVASLVLPAYWETWQMLIVVAVTVLVVGSVLGVLLHNFSPDGLFPARVPAAVLGTVVNVGRSLPFIVLMASIIPFTRLLVGTAIGIPAAVVPMSIAAIPFFARMTQQALRTVDPDVIDLGIVSGSTTWQIIRKVQFAEVLPTVVGATTITLVALIEFSTIAGTMGAGGIGYMAVNYGYNRFDPHVMIACVVILILTIQAVQFLGDRLAQRLSK